MLYSLFQIIKSGCRKARVGKTKIKKTMKKISILSVIFTFLVLSGYGQLSDRQNNPTTFKIGTRPVAGNMGIYLGGTIQNIGKTLDDDFSDANIDPTTLTMNDMNTDASKSRIPSVLLKFYKKDNLVYRAGIYTKRQSSTIKGSLNSVMSGFSGDAEYSRKVGEFLVLPGIEKHFAPSNIIDVYVGANVPLGWVKSYYMDKTVTAAGTESQEQKRLSLTYGFGAFVGIQMFIADLPVAVGTEFLYQGRGYLFNRVKHTDVNGATTQTYYTVAGDDGTNYQYYTTLKARKYTSENNINFFISYYFNR
jgi:hypothetical protein